MAEWLRQWTATPFFMSSNLILVSKHTQSRPIFEKFGNVEQLVGSPDCKSGFFLEHVGSNPTISTIVL